MNHRVFEWASSGVSADCFSQYGIAYSNIKYECDFQTLSTFNNFVNMYEFLVHTFFYLSTAAANCMVTLTNSVALSVNNDLSATLVCNSQCV